MKPIKICPENAAAIEKALNDANGRARAHTFTSYHAIEGLAEQAEKDLQAFGVTKARRCGARYNASSGGPLPKAYDNKAIQTGVCLDRRSNAWYLVAACTLDLWPRQNPTRELIVTQAQADEACKRLLATVTIRQPPEQQKAA